MLVYINALIDNVETNMKMFDNNKFLFFAAGDETNAAQGINIHFEKVCVGVCEWKIAFNAKKTVENCIQCQKN